MHRFLTAAAAVFIGINAFLGGGSVSAQPSTYGDAMKWYEREAAKGTAKAQFLLGLLYERGAGPRGKDAAAAYGWFLKAAEQGYPRAEYKVGVALQFAIGTPADPDKAVTTVQLTKAPTISTSPCAKLMRLMMPYTIV